VDTADAAMRIVAPVAASTDSSHRTDTTRSAPRMGVERSDKRPRALVACWRWSHEPGGPDSLPEPAWTRKPEPRSPPTGAFHLKRRVRNRRHGAVGGRREQSRLLPDKEA